MPALRKSVVQLLGDLQYSGDAKRKEESAKLLSKILRAAASLMGPYVNTIIRVLLPQLKYANGKVSISVLAALGELSISGGTIKNKKKFHEKNFFFFFHDFRA